MTFIYWHYVFSLLIFYNILCITWWSLLLIFMVLDSLYIEDDDIITLLALCIQFTNFYTSGGVFY